MKKAKPPLNAIACHGCARITYRKTANTLTSLIAKALAQAIKEKEKK